VNEALSPSRFASASSFGLLVLLVEAGVGSIGFDVLLGHPEAALFAREGRVVIGEVTYRSRNGPLNGERPARNHSLIFLDDAHLGPQVVDIYGELPVGQRVPVLCLTPAGRCESADVVHERLSLWPLTPLMLSGAVELALAVTLLVARRQTGRGRHRTSVAS
jgi:hypothetical protein